MEKTKVVIEEIDEDKVAVYQFDDISNGLMGAPFEVCNKATAMETYNVVGEQSVESGILMYDGEEPEENFSEFENADEDDCYE